MKRRDVPCTSSTTGPLLSTPRRRRTRFIAKEVIMAANALSQSSARIAPVEPRLAPLVCLAILIASCALASLALACATPFAAFAVLAAAMLPLRPALLVVFGAWLVNQGIGFGVHHYPIDASTIAWGFVIGAAALAATLVAVAALSALPVNRTPLMLAIALACAYCAYELVLFAATPFLGGAGAFTAAIVSRLGALNVVWLIGLVVACEVIRLLNPFSRRHALSE
jgi:hypothetical protein